MVLTTGEPQADNAAMPTTPRKRRSSPTLLGRRYRLVLSEYDQRRRYYRPTHTVRFASAAAEPIWRAVMAALHEAVGR